MKYFGYVLVAVIAFVAAIFVTKADLIKIDDMDFSDTGDSAFEQLEPTEYTTYYSQLTDYQKKIYDGIYDVIKNQKESVDFKNVDIAEFRRNAFRATTAFEQDHPEFFWYTGGYTVTSSRSTFEEKGDIEFSPYYYSYANSFFNEKSKAEELKNAVNKVADLARQHSSNGYDQLVFVHDYLIENAIYDHDALDEYYKTNRSPSCEYIFSAYGCLVNGKTVCAGFAKAFQMIARELGFDCSYVTGDAGGAHGWNCIYIDGEGYYVDITWDNDDKAVETPRYDYAFIDSETLSRTHEADDEFEVPVCKADEYNYFHYYGYYLEEYSFSAASDILSSQSGNDAVFIKFGSMEEVKSAYRELVSSFGYKRISAINDYGDAYLNDEHYIVGFYK